MTTATADTAAIEALAERYGEAWNAQDLDGILARHAEDALAFQSQLEAPS
jgi:ketosteroid isomerase-like protein